MVVNVGSRIAEIRRARGLTQTDLAKRAHVSLATVKNCERDRHDPQTKTAIALADALQVSPATLHKPVGRPIPKGRNNFKLGIPFLILAAL